nr:FMN-binding glutamate synthase family protein [Psychroflexus curvus]
MREAIRFTFIALVIIAIITCTVIWPVYGFSILGAMIFGLGIYDLFQKNHTILRNFPVLGHMRYLLEMIGPEINQYFVENGTDGKPIDRNHRSYIYERAKLQNKTHPFGTELNVEEENYKWMKHSIYPSEILKEPPRVLIGGPDCKQTYSASVFNISAMSYGALSKNATMALNLGAKEGDFFQNTGEGGISEYHLKGGDLVYQLGTGYFGCRTMEGSFLPEKFEENAAKTAVKMIEIKLSQGAKPGHGGVLPAAKNSKEIAEIRGVKPHTNIHSPMGHQAFKNSEDLLLWVKELRELSQGKPIGFKLSIGDKQEFIDICEKMIETGIKPDFITVDGSEGGTGAAPIDFSDYVGMPWEKALIFVVDTLNGYDLKKDIKIITATKIIRSFDIFRALCLGADLCNSARGMMFALGCIQALRCDTNKCPTGITTNNPSLMRGLVVEDKWKRVKNYHNETVKEFLELFAASGCKKLSDLNRSFIFKQIETDIKCYEEVYPTITAGKYLQ